MPQENKIPDGFDENSSDELSDEQLEIAAGGKTCVPVDPIPDPNPIPSKPFEPSGPFAPAEPYQI